MIPIRNEKILYLFGSTTIDQQNGMFVRMASNQSLLYDTTTNTWNITVLNGAYRVSSRLDGNAVLNNVLPLLFVHDHEGRIFSDTTGPDQKTIYFFAGDDGGAPWSRRFRNGVDILDTSTWQWIRPSIQGSPPRLRSFASAGLISNDYIIFAYGT